MIVRKAYDPCRSVFLYESKFWLRNSLTADTPRFNLSSRVSLRFTSVARKSSKNLTCFNEPFLAVILLRQSFFIDVSNGLLTQYQN